MIVKYISKNFYLIKIPKNKIGDIDIYNRDDVKKLIKVIFKKIIKKHKIKGLIYFNIYYDVNYGMIIEVIIKNIVFYDDEIDVKISFFINNFLYEIDYFEGLDIDCKVIYYKDNKYYMEIKKEVDMCKYLPLLEQYNIIYKDIDKVLEGSIKLV